MISRRLALWVIAPVSLAIAVLMQEFAVRLALPQFDPGNHLRFVPDAASGVPLGIPDTTQRLIKNSGDYDVTVRFNRHGIRDRRDIADAGKEDLVVVGDSFGFGWGVEERDRFSDRLERLVGRRVFNVSAPADFDGYEKLIRYAVARGADIRNVIIAVNMVDDIRVYGMRSDAPPRDPAPPGGAGGIGLPHIKEFLLTHSSLYFMATSQIHRIGWIKDLAAAAGLIVPLKNIGGEASRSDAIVSSAARLAKLAGRYRTTILVIPSVGLWLQAKQDHIKRTHEAFVSRLRQFGLSVIDMRPVLEASGKPRSYHFANDGHWNARGHFEAAKAIAYRLRQAGGNR